MFNFAKLNIIPPPYKPIDRITIKSIKVAKEIERKFLVKDESYKAISLSTEHIIQGYISRRKEGTVRIRVKNDRAYITVKGITAGISRDEWEYPIPVEDALAMLKTACEGNVIDKTRHIVKYDGFIWEVDEFHGDREGLTLAEVELPDITTQPRLPSFVGKEVSGNPAYYNSNL